MDDVRYILKKPDGKVRKRFSLVCYKPISRTKKEYIDLPDSLRSDVNSINMKFLNKTITEYEAETLLVELIQTEYRKSKIPEVAIKHAIISEANSRVLSRFWADKYAVRYLEDDSAARYDFERAFRAIEPLSIQAASQADLQKALKKNLPGANQIRRASNRLNEVLRYLKRDFKLEKPRKVRKDVSHLTKADFLKMVPEIGCKECKDLAMTLFASGARLGESMVFKETDLHGLELSITKQRTTRSKEIKGPKRDKSGTVAVLDWGLKGLKSWIKVQDKWAHRWHFGTELEAACAKAKVKRISPHDLRHSHAIHLLSLGATLTDVSMNLRNRIEVCQEYYTGYAHSEGTLDRLKRITSKDEEKVE